MAEPGDADSDMSELEGPGSRASTPVAPHPPQPQQGQTPQPRAQTVHYVPAPGSVPVSPYTPYHYGANPNPQGYVFQPNTYPTNLGAYPPPPPPQGTITPEQLTAILQLLNPQASTLQTLPAQQAIAIHQLLQGLATPAPAPFSNPFTAPNGPPQPPSTAWVQPTRRPSSQPPSRKTSSSTESASTPQSQSRKNSATATAPGTSHAAASGMSRAKRKRTDAPTDKERSKDQSGSTEAMLVEQIEANRALMELIQAQHRQTQEQLAIISNNTHHMPNRDQLQEPLLAQAEVLKGLLDGNKETNDLLRIGFTALNDKDGDVKPAIHTNGGGDTTMGESDDEMEVETPPRKKARSGPAHREEKSVSLSREFRKMFKATFRGHVLDPGTAGQPPSMENFVLDLEKPPGSSWNKASKNMFVSTVIDSHVPEIVELAPSREDLNRQFINNFRSARLKLAWSKLSDGEKKRKKEQARRKGRRRWLWYRRVTAAKRFKETRRHLPMLAAYGADGMSSDESSHDNGTGQAIYKVVNKIWRHPNATACLRTLDRVHRDSRFAPVREVGPGAHAHNRVISDKQTFRPAVRGLPAGLYNPGWLTNQPPVFKQDLEVVPSDDYDFSHDATIEDLTRQWNHGQLDTVHIFT